MSENADFDLECQLRDAIRASGQSLNQLGLAASVDDGQLSRFMRGQRGLSLETAGRICRVLGLRFCRVDEPPQPRGRARKAEGDADKVK